MNKTQKVVIDSRQDMINYAKSRISEIKSDLADPTFDRWIKELKIDLKRWEDQLQELEAK